MVLFSLPASAPDLAPKAPTTGCVQLEWTQVTMSGRKSITRVAMKAWYKGGLPKPCNLQNPKGGHPHLWQGLPH